MSTVIKVENLAKKYIIGHQRNENYQTLRDAMAAGARNLGRRLLHPLRSSTGQPMLGTDDTEEFWALRDVRFEVQQGERIGIIGRNGAGKSTLLKILSRIVDPTIGAVKVKGRIASLLEVGTGFHPELSGRENIYLNGAILGMSRRDVSRKFDDIVEFADVDQFLDTPVKRYSSGMYVRLAFAVAANLDADILIVDEVLAVGDAAFQQKCLGKMGEVAGDGRTILFVSHNLPAIENLCNEAILLDAGKICSKGVPSAVIQEYLASTIPLKVSRSLSLRNDRVGSGVIKFTSFYVENVEGQRVSRVQTGMDVVFVFRYKCRTAEKLKKVDIGFGAFAENGQLLFVIYSSYLGKIFDDIPPDGEIRCLIKRLPLTPEKYRIGARLTVNGEEADWPNDGIGYLDVAPGDFFKTGNTGFGGMLKCPFVVDGEWTHSEMNANTHAEKC